MRFLFGSSTGCSSCRRLVLGEIHLHVLQQRHVGIGQPEARTVTFSDGSTEPYDYLVVATGVQYDYFGHNRWAALTLNLDSIEKAPPDQEACPHSL